ncbi:MAG: OmpA family protein [Flavobacteriaceae bacterium]|nr:OmpA family protein [Flavobacteriaceae bacterium]
MTLTTKFNFLQKFKQIKIFITVLISLFTINLSALNINPESNINSCFKGFKYSLHQSNCSVNDTIDKSSKSQKVIRDVGNAGKKLLKKIKELFAMKHKIPKDYVQADYIQLIAKDSLSIIKNNLGIIPKLKLLYPRITPSKGYFSFQVGDYEYFKYVKDININEIEYIKLISDDGSECYIDKFEFIKKDNINRHFAFLLDHSGSMGRKRASILQNSLYEAIEKNTSVDQNSTYNVYKFSEYTRRIAKSQNAGSIAASMLPANGLKGFGGGTAVKDALIHAITDLNNENKNDFKIIVLLTDGDSNSDLQKLPMEEVVKSATKNNINIVSVAFGSYLNIDYLKDIAEYSGGDLFHIYSPEEFKILFDNIFQDIILSYDLEFVPCLFGDDVQLEMKIVSNDLVLKGRTVFRTPLTTGYTIDLSINFDNNSANISPKHTRRLETIYKLMKFKPTLKILVEGHSDRSGSEKINISLSNKRASSVKNFLVGKGISSNRIQVKGYGSSNPAFDYAPGTNENALNRRIQIVVLSE